MFNFHSYYCFCCAFCCIAQILSFNPTLEARNYSNFEFNIDPNAIRNCNTLDEKIDCLIDVGMQYQKATNKNFKYKKFLKQTYKHLENHNVHVDKKMKKDLKKRIQDRISSRFFEHKERRITTRLRTFHCGVASSKNPNGDYSNEFRVAVVEITTGVVLVAFGPPPMKVAGGGVMVDGTTRMINATVDYIWPEPSERDRSGERERDRDGQRPSLADRERDSQDGRR